MLDLLVLKTVDPCAWCGHEYGTEDLVLVESGRLYPMRKDPSTLVFEPDWLVKQKELKTSARSVMDRLIQIPILVKYVKVFHFGCFFRSMSDVGLGWDGRGIDRYCSSCDHDFKNTNWGYRYSIGGVGQNNTFEIDINVPRPQIMCTACTAKVFGGGDRVLGDSIIHDHLNT